MSYIAIRKDAIDEIISQRLLQSTDFDQGTALIKAIQSKLAVLEFPRLGMKATKTGLFIFGTDTAEDHFLVIDCDQAQAFSPSANSSQALLFLQKSLRFCSKYWQGGILKPSEIIARNSTRGIVFPFPISQQTSVRIVIDLAPDAERLARRGRSGRFVLLFKVGADDSGAGEQPTLGNFRRFLEELESIGAGNFVIESSGGDEVAIPGFSTVTLGEIREKIDPHQAYETWMHLLTNDQKTFVTSELRAPRRVDGPAGSGKTVSLALAAIHALRRSSVDRAPFNGIFITHSEPSRRSIQTIIESMGGEEFLTSHSSVRRLQVGTLQSYCASILRQDLSSTEFVDPDAFDAKQLQSMYVEEALKGVESELSTYERFISSELREFLAQEEDALKISMIQHEIAVVIKGRSKENLDVYKRIPPISAGLPLKSDSDKGLIWRIYESYRNQLVVGGQFDTDDVVLTALSQLATPIWRRRRVRDGFDAVFVDETHLFNMNELSIFHHLTKSEVEFPIAFAVDRAQAIGDRGWTDDIDIKSLVPFGQEISTSKTSLRSIFRSSPEIVNLAFTITSSGANLFTNFDDPLLKAHSNMSFEEEKKAIPPFYVESINDESMIESAFSLADEMRTEMSTSRGEVAIIAFTESLFASLQRWASDQGKPIEVLKQRGDEELTNRAKTTGRFVLSLADYVGGLEFDGVVLLGVDEGRVPPFISSHRAESKAYMTFAAHNRLYVAVSRARYRVAILGTKERGPSSVLSGAFASDALIRN